MRIQVRVSQREDHLLSRFQAGGTRSAKRGTDGAAQPQDPDPKSTRPKRGLLRRKLAEEAGPDAVWTSWNHRG
jgi:hypothetical protein